MELFTVNNYTHLYVSISLLITWNTYVYLHSQRPRIYTTKSHELFGLNSKITANQLSELTSLSRRGIEYNIDKLKKEKKIKRIGEDKGGHWKTLKQ